MANSILENSQKLSSQLPEKIPYVKLLVLFGSRATGKNHDSSDWDFAVLYEEKAEGKQDQEKYERYLEVLDYLSEVLKINRDAIDLVELDRCSPLLGHQVARDGKLIYESHVGEFLKFRVRAWKIYADTAKFRKVQKESIHLWLKKWGLQ
ncbi:type VII toxin-antitoxin system MntA family adenylyltransferase antitoxin [Microcystis aeruginosa]|uniref:Similar to tr/Q3CJ33/Q3CJ33_THEET DNA polymerase n=1 Tax=Microcystis aeruginosa PCC 9701 TaxID=721123 RepID=I4IL60_MICAE|nr:nucleotidyltransferase domain-containing protein [Microcystis aeruginosa]CCI35034.1 Similar to tr/Q3CJ33/Q3CJ33_THEET DNA polymerase [Microcystis aeruginosa PCC 9701]